MTLDYRQKCGGCKYACPQGLDNTTMRCTAWRPKKQVVVFSADQPCQRYKHGNRAELEVGTFVQYDDYLTFGDSVYQIVSISRYSATRRSYRLQPEILGTMAGQSWTRTDRTHWSRTSTICPLLEDQIKQVCKGLEEIKE